MNPTLRNLLPPILTAILCAPVVYGLVWLALAL